MAMKKKINNVIISGALGRIGTILMKEIKKKKHINVIHALIKNHNHNINQKINDNNICKKKNFFITLPDLKLDKKILEFDTLIDFSTPIVTLKTIKYCIKKKKNIIIGTTGFNKKQIYHIQQAAKKIPILLSPNFSIGINIMHKVIEYISVMLGNNTDVEIIEYHHRNKIDAPSGTALQLGKVISKAMHWDFNTSAIFSRHGNIGIREKNKIGFSSIREGNTIGKHTVLFSNNYESISIQHTATNRSIFTQGVLKAIEWIYKKKSGLYNMSDVLKENKHPMMK